MMWKLKDWNLESSNKENKKIRIEKLPKIQIRRYIDSKYFELKSIENNTEKIKMNKI